MSSFKAFSSQEVPNSTGVERLHKFLERSGFVDSVSDSKNFKTWLDQLSFNEFQEYLVRINGIVRETPVNKRTIDGEEVGIGNEMLGVGFVPPHNEDKLDLLQQAFERIKTMQSVDDQGLLLYLITQYLHLFEDGNGRLGRLLFYLAYKASESSKIDPNEMQGLLSHTDESGPGRNLFFDRVKPPPVISSIVNHITAQNVLSEEFFKQGRRPYPENLMAGRVEIDNENLETKTKEQLESVLSEADGGKYSFRDLVLVKYMENHDQLEEYESFLDTQDMSEQTKQVQGTIYRYDAHRLLSSLSEEDAQEILELSRQLKKRFVETLIEIISEPNKYRISDEKTAKDLFYA